MARRQLGQRANGCTCHWLEESPKPPSLQAGNPHLPGNNWNYKSIYRIQLTFSERRKEPRNGIIVETSKQLHQETTYAPAGGRLGSSGAGAQGRIEDVTGDQVEIDRQYKERVEDEYAKREGDAYVNFLRRHGGERGKEKECVRRLDD
jgi:hypothetical protein